jgi:F420-non-reducing hydrogenase iron-sulfur subunit
VQFLKQLLDFSGIEGDRLRAKWVSSAEAPEFAEEIRSFVDKLKTLGPSPLRKRKSGVAAA